MKLIKVLGLIALTLSIIACNEALKSNLDTADSIQKLKFHNLRNEEVKLSAYTGKWLLLNFWATWCPPCIAEMPALNNLQLQFKDKKFEVLAINVDQKRQLVDEFLNDKEFTFTVLLDPELSSVDKFGISGFPESVFISPTGKVLQVFDPAENKYVTRFIGDRQWDNKEYIELVNQLLASPDEK